MVLVLAAENSREFGMLSQDWLEESKAQMCEMEGTERFESHLEYQWLPHRQ